MENFTRIFLVVILLLAMSGCMRIEGGDGANIQVYSVMDSSFMDVPVFTSRTQTFTLKNIGGFDASSVVLPTIPVPFSLVSTTCTADLKLNETCDVTIRYQPTT